MGVTLPLAVPGELREVLARALDAALVRESLGAALPALGGGPVEIVSCKARPGRLREALRKGRALWIHYELTVRHADGRQWARALLGTTPVGPGWLEAELGGACRAAEGHPAIAPFRHAGAYLEGLRMAVVLFPVDPELPALAEVTGPRGAVILGPHLPECRGGAGLAGISAELVHYKPCSRCVLRVTASFGAGGAAPRRVFVKLFADDRGAGSHRSLEALWEASRGAEYLRVPEPLGYDAERRMAVMAEAPGERALTEWLRCLACGEPLPAGVDPVRVRRGVVVAARAAAELHRLPLEFDGRRTFRAELVHLRKEFAAVKSRVPEFAPQVAALLDGLDRAAPDDETLVPSHGGYRHKQMVGDERTLTVIDWDGLTMASPALDGATFIRRLLREHVRRPAEAAPAVELAALFRREILAAEPDLPPRHLDLYEAVSLAEDALRSFSRPKHKDAVAAELARVFAAAEGLLLGRPAPWH